MPDVINIETKDVGLDAVRPHPANPRRGNVDAIRESIDENGFYGRVVVQKSTGYILAGNHRYLAAKEAGLDVLPVDYVDVDDERAMRILLADNRTNDLATYDDQALADMLEHLASTDTGLLGTGYDARALEDLEAVLNAVPVIPNGFPQREPELEADHFIGIYCAADDLADFMDTLNTWAVRDGVTVNIS